MPKLFAVMMPWKHDGITMKPIETFHTREEAVEYRKDMDGWEIVEIPEPHSTISPGALCEELFCINCGGCD